MRHLVRLPKPAVLLQREVNWTNAFINSGNIRPNNVQYGHLEIRTQLHNISFKKCFYSEVKFAAETEGQVDHYIEVSENKNLAFDWDNLFLSHKDSNQGKPSNIALPNNTTLNPFLHTDNEIENHISFEGECVRGISPIGLNTIQKYKLEFIFIRNNPKSSLVIFGLSAGIIGGLTNVMAPILIIYYLELKYTRKEIIQSANICFFFGKLIQIFLFSIHGSFTQDVLTISFESLVVVVFAMFIGIYIKNRIVENRYNQIIKNLLFLILNCQM